MAIQRFNSNTNLAQTNFNFVAQNTNANPKLVAPQEVKTTQKTEVVDTFTRTTKEENVENNKENSNNNSNDNKGVQKASKLWRGLTFGGGATAIVSGALGWMHAISGSIAGLGCIIGGAALLIGGIGWLINHFKKEKVATPTE